VSGRRGRSPSFDDLEPPAVEGSPIGGLTDAQWVARRERSERNFRILFGAIFGAAVGLLSMWHWGFLRPRAGLPALLVLGGSMLLFAALFAQRRDNEALGHASWIVFPEWNLAARMPWWAIVALLATALALLAILAAVVVVGAFSVR
jgi:multisubunit Na+/H+ antiporter MnhB subunit